jgi:hypothetical protein
MAIDFEKIKAADQKLKADPALMTAFDSDRVKTLKDLGLNLDEIDAYLNSGGPGVAD